MYPVTIVKLLVNLKCDTHLRNHDHNNQTYQVKTLHFNNILDLIVSVVGDCFPGRPTLHKSTVAFNCIFLFYYCLPSRRQHTILDVTSVLTRAQSFYRAMYSRPDLDLLNFAMSVCRHYVIQKTNYSSYRVELDNHRQCLSTRRQLNMYLNVKYDEPRFHFDSLTACLSGFTTYVSSSRHSTDRL